MNIQNGRNIGFSKRKRELEIDQSYQGGVAFSCSAGFLSFFGKMLEMSENCNNSACYFVEFYDCSDISVTFAFYNHFINKETYLPSGRKEKTAAGQADFSCLYFSPCGGFKRLKPPFFYPPKE